MSNSLPQSIYWHLTQAWSKMEKLPEINSLGVPPRILQQACNELRQAFLTTYRQQVYEPTSSEGPSTDLPDHQIDLEEYLQHSQMGTGMGDS
jgi:hypothetical protein